MKLILKRIPPMLNITSLSDAEEQLIEVGDKRDGPFALHTEDGQILPCQVSTTLISNPHQTVQLHVTFTVDGNKIRVEGDE